MAYWIYIIFWLTNLVNQNIIIMKIRILVLLVFNFIIQLNNAQVILNANGSGNTYEDINAILAPGYNVIEVPDCVHTTFGRHIDEIFDAELNTNVFRFFAHKTSDNDRCIRFDRQRTEIKAYDKSPDNLKATLGETVQYKWKFKIPTTFQVSSSFTHLHQIKSVDGPYASIPMITLTARKATPDRLELRYTPTNDQNTIATAELDLLRGNWIEVNEIITYGNPGSYSIVLKRVSNGSNIMNYSNTNIDTWQDGATFARPKWGIYRSLNSINDLQDEEVLFANFSIEENPTLSSSEFENSTVVISLFPNPAKQTITIKNIKIDSYDTIKIFDNTGKELLIQNRHKKEQLDISNFKSGLYFVSILKNERTIKTIKFLVE